MATKIVVGLGFGDEGKGLVTDWLASQEPSRGIVVRFNGGHQAGHTVYREDGSHHTFSCFGSGTFQNFDTFFSKYCTIFPPAIMAERGVIYEKYRFFPRLMIDALCPVTTPYDLIYNQVIEESRQGLRHGSVGVGFGATIERHEASPYKLYAMDLQNEEILHHKLHQIRSYYETKLGNSEIGEAFYKELEAEKLFDLEFRKECKNVCTTYKIVMERVIFNQYLSAPIIFEGAQGVMLDMDHGYFPHVTRSNTTCKNAIEIIKRNSLPDPEIYYVTRAYQTRHGQGPLPNINHTQNKLILENPDEHNKQDPWQGTFRKALLDLSTLKHAIDIDQCYFKGRSKHLVVTCLDHFKDGEIWVTGQTYGQYEKQAMPMSVTGIVSNIRSNFNFASVYTSNSPYGKNMELVAGSARKMLIRTP